MALPNKTKIPVGTVLAGKYRVTREIGRGGMAAVYEAAHVDIGKRVAIKVLAQELTTSAVVVERFLREARAAAAIRSPYICDIYDSGKLDDGRPFLVLELLEGESLYERMTKIRWLDIETTISIVTQVCRGLTKAHSANIVHRDLKPENIFVTKNEEGQLLAKILDFGLAKFYTPMESDGPQARLTREGAVFGTPAYMSPEQVRGQGAVDHRADLWALGCIVYECFTGRTVWSTEQGVAMTFAQIANAQLPRPATYRPDLPEAFTEWFDRALNRDIAERFQSAKEFAEKFAAVFNKERPEFSTIGPTPAILLQHKSALAEGLENPFLPGAPSGHSLSAIPVSAPRLVAPDAVTEPPPPRTSAPHTSGPAVSSIPVDLVNDGASNPHASLPGGGEHAAGPPSPRPSKLGFADDEAGRRSPKRAGPLARVMMLLGGLTLAGGLGVGVWMQLNDAPAAVRTGTSASAMASDAPTSTLPTDASAIPSNRPIAEAPAPPWMALVREGQQAIAAGDLKGASKLFKEAYDKFGGPGVPRTLGDHLAVAIAAGDRGPCRLTGLARPRSYDLVSTSIRSVNTGRPSIAVGAHGAVVTWTDAHEGSEHAYAVALDEVLRDRGAPVDVTPEGNNVLHPDLVPAGEKLVLVYGDGKGPEAGVHARFLDADGRIGGPSVAITLPKAGSFWPSVAKAPDGTFYVAWSDEGDTDSEDLFLRHLGLGLEPAGEVVRATDLVPAGPSKPRVRFPSISVAGDAVQVAFRLEREPVRLIDHLRLPLADAGKGLPPPKKGDRKDRNIGDLVLVNTDKSKADGPSLACGAGTCFLAWHVEQGGGAWAASIDPATAKPVARWHFTRTGGHPAVAVSAAGQAQLVWYENKQVFTAAITRDGVGVASRVARISAEEPLPSIAPGSKPGEWYLAWLDYEIGHLEAYAARVQCK
jgi:eukaryotic-like serine/threonine-protein kinase